MESVEWPGGSCHEDTDRNSQGEARKVGNGARGWVVGSIAGLE